MSAAHATQTLRAYERWAARYPPEPHNPLMRVEQGQMLAQLPAVRGRRVLDLACGSGRYTGLLAQQDPHTLVAVDNCGPMLEQVRGAHAVQADMQRLPFAAQAFDLIVCGLALAHTDALGDFMQEAARVLAPHGVLLYSDFHPEAARARLTRSFRDADGTWTVPQHVFSVDEQLAAARAAGLAVETVRELRVGRELTEAFPGSDAFYRDWHDLPLVLIIRAVW